MFGYRITTKHMNLVIQKKIKKMATEILQNHLFSVSCFLEIYI